MLSGAEEGHLRRAATLRQLMHMVAEERVPVELKPCGDHQCRTEEIANPQGRGAYRSSSSSDGLRRADPYETDSVRIFPA